jgi:eukaryotic-like serine/threonine-protein kinase
MDESDARWKRLTEIFTQLRGLEPAERARLLDEACAGDNELRAQVEHLLDGYSAALKFFAHPSNLPLIASDPNIPQRTFSDGDTVAERFRIIRLLGAGGMGEVYEAEDFVLRNERIALKTLRASLAADDSAVNRLIGELQMARQITHRNVCRVYDVYQHQAISGHRIVCFTMELLKGHTLADRLARGAITTKDALPIVKQLAAALDEAHSANVAHGDFKPGNIMLVESEIRGERVVVTDFGLGRWLPAGTALLSTTAGSRQWGTPGYMAPEQLMGGGVTRATDIYSLGVVVYEMVTGRLPFSADAPLLLALRKLRHRPRPPREYIEDLDPRWQAGILRCLDVDPGRRFQFANDLVGALETNPSRRTALAAGVVGVAAALALTWAGTQLIEERGAVPPTVERTVAVLPFVPANRSPESDALALGLTAALSDEIDVIAGDDPGLHVIPVEEVINTGVNTPALAQQTLGASHSVTGRLNVVNNRTDVTLELNALSDKAVRVTDSRSVSISSGNRSFVDAVAVATAQLLQINQGAVQRNGPGGEVGHLEAERSYLLGRGYLARGATELPAAIDAFQRAIKQNDQFALAHAGLSEAYRAQYVATREANSIRLAQASADRAVDLKPLDARLRVTRGRVYLMSSQLQRAILEFSKALELDPDSDARRFLASAYEADGAMDKAEEMYRAAVARHPKHWSAHEVVGTFLYRQGRHHEAEESLVQGSAYAPANPTAILNLSAVYLAQEKFAAAEGELKRGTELSPDARLYNNLAWVYILEAKFSDAVAAMESAAKLPGVNSLTWSSLARAYRWAGGRDVDARAAYKTALQRADEELRLNPSDAQVKGNRAYLLAETGQTEEALREIQESIALDTAKANVIVLFNSALIHEWVGDRKRALQDLLVAARAGYSKGVIERHPDLTKLRTDPGYRQVLELAGKPAI